MSLFLPYVGPFDEDEIAVILLLRALVVVLVSVVVRHRRRSRVGWFIFGFFIPSLALLIAGFLRTKRRRHYQTSTANDIDLKDLVDPYSSEQKSIDNTFTIIAVSIIVVVIVGYLIAQFAT